MGGCSQTPYTSFILTHVQQLLLEALQISIIPTSSFDPFLFLHTGFDRELDGGKVWK